MARWLLGYSKFDGCEVLESGDEKVEVAGSCYRRYSLFAGVRRHGHLSIFFAGDFLGVTRRDVGVAVDRLSSALALRHPARCCPERRDNLLRVSSMGCRLR